MPAVPEGSSAYRPDGASIGVVVGNPKPASRTLSVALAVADSVGRAVGLSHAERTVVDLAELGPRLFDWSDATVRAAVRRTSGCTALVVASPTYKGPYTGLLKSFLDWFSTTALSGVCTVPVMVGAGSRHALALDVHLRPVLIELGATTPTRGLFVLESELDELDRVIQEWLVEAGPLLRTSMAAGPR